MQYSIGELIKFVRNWPRAFKIVFLAGALSSVFGGSAFATLITGTLSLNGTDTYDSDSISFIGNGNIGVATGDFSVLGTCTGCVELTSFNFASLSSPVTVYTITVDGITTSLTLTSIDYETSADGVLTVIGTGIVSLTGYDDTEGTFYLSSQGPDNTVVTFSTTTVAIPEPTPLAVLGSGLLLLGLLCGRSKIRRHLPRSGHPDLQPRLT